MSGLFDTGDGSEEELVFYVKDAEVVLMNNMRLEKDGYAQTRPDMLDQMDYVSTSKKNFAHLMCNAYTVSDSDCTTVDILMPENETVFWKDYVVEGTLSLVGIVQVYTDRKLSSLQANATVVIMAYMVLLKFEKRFRRFHIEHGHTLIAFVFVAFSEISADAGGTGAAIKQ